MDVGVYLTELYSGKRELVLWATVRKLEDYEDGLASRVIYIDGEKDLYRETVEDVAEKLGIEIEDVKELSDRQKEFIEAKKEKERRLHPYYEY